MNDIIVKEIFSYIYTKHVGINLSLVLLPNTTDWMNRNNSWSLLTPSPTYTTYTKIIKRI